MKPSPNYPHNAVVEIVSVVKCTLSGIVHHERILGEINDVVLAVNRVRKRMSMLVKELLLAKLEANEKLPQLDQNFYATITTALKYGKWAHGHNNILLRRTAPEEYVKQKSVLPQATSLVARKLAAELKTHYETHYERFYRRWKKVTDAKNDNNEHFLDPSTALLNDLVKSAWCMRRCIEDAGERGFALFPESKMRIGFVTLDSMCIGSIFKQLYREKCKDSSGKIIPTNELVALQRERVFGELFSTYRVEKQNCPIKLKISNGIS